jgi:hypothetical protein
VSEPYVPGGHAYRGSSVRETPLTHTTGIGPWAGEVRLTPVLDVGGQPVQFEVNVQWDGPPLPLGGWSEPDYSGQPTHVSDSYYTPDVDLARRLAQEAVEALRKPERYDLRERAQAIAAGAG